MGTMTTGPASRLARSAIFAVVCVGTTGTGHAMASGGFPPAWLVLCSFLTVTTLAWTGAGRVRGGVQVIGATTVAQLALHAAFVTAHAPSGSPDPRHPAGMARGPKGVHAHSGGGMDRSQQTLDSPALAGDLVMPSCEHGTSAGMVLAHLVAGLLCGLWIWRGDVAVVRLGQALMLSLCAPLRLAGLLATSVVPQGQPSVVPPGYVEPAGLGWAPIYHVASRRGPPRHACFL